LGIIQNLKKMKKIILFSLVFVSIFLLNGNLNAQENANNNNSKILVDSSNLVVITLNDGAQIKGFILYKNLEEVSLKTDFAGTIVLKQTDIVSVVNYNVLLANKTINTKNPNNLNIMKFGGSSNNNQKGSNYTYKASQKYFVNNSYLGLKKRELVYQNIYLFYNDCDYGLTDNFSIGGGFVFLGNLSTINLHFRSQIELNELLKIGATYNVFIIPADPSYAIFGITSGGFTIGNLNKNISFSIGQGNIKSLDSKADVSNSFNNIAYAVSGVYKINEGTSIITDNFYMEKSNMKFYSIGFRFHSKNIVFDLGYMGNTYIIDENYYDYMTGTNILNRRESNNSYPFLALTYKIK